MRALPRLTVNYVELALDVIVSDKRTACQIREIFDNYFVQSWPGKHEIVLQDGGSYSGQRRPGRRFAWYKDRPSKRTKDPHCLHLEGRYQGMSAVRRIGIHKPSDLLDFDHTGYWKNNLNLFFIDLERLGRWHLNRISGQRRHRSRMIRSGPLDYNIDRATGQMLFRIVSSGLKSDRRQHHRSVQEFVKNYGRGPFLRRLDASVLQPQ